MTPVDQLMAGPGFLDSESGDPHVKNSYVNCDPDPGTQRRRRPLPTPPVPPVAVPEPSSAGPR